MAQSPTAALATTPAPPVARTRLTIACALGMIMFGGVQVAPAVCLDTLGDELNLSYEQRGALMALRMVALTLCLLVVGHFGEHRKKYLVFFAGLMVIALGEVMTAKAGGYRAMLLAMAVSGLGYGVYEALLNPLIAQLYPDNSARALNVMNGLFSVGLVAGALSTGEIVQGGLSWRLAFWLWAVPPLICALLYLTPRFPQPVADADDLAPTPAVSQFLRLPLFWVLMVSMVLGGGVEAGLTSWAPNFAAKVLSASARAQAWTTILYGTFMAVGRFGSGLLTARVRPVPLMLVSAVLCGAATYGIAFSQSLPFAYALFSLGGLFVACFWPTLLAVASDRISQGSTSLFSLLAAAGVSGCALVPWAIGALGDVVGLRSAVLVLPVSMALLVVMLLAASRLVPHRQNQAAEGSG